MLRKQTRHTQVFRLCLGGAEYPVMVRREMKKNIRVWLQDGAEDQENARAGSWPLANIEMANSLKLKGDDYHFSFGFGDPSQEFVQDPAEKDLPLWRVVTLNRN